MPGRWMLGHRRWAVISLAACAAAMAAGLAAPGAATAATGPVSPTPASGTPQLANTGKPQEVRQLVQCGNTMYAVGSFTTIKRFSTTYTRNNVFSFSAIAPYKVTSWDPNVNGVVNSITFSPGNCAHAYIGGKFTSVGGTAATNIAEIDTTTGAVITGFRHSANGQVETLLGYGNHIIAGGYYTSINNSSAHKYMTSLNATTGVDDGFINLNISGNYQFCNTSRCTSSNPTRIYNQQLSNGGTLDLVEGDFTSVGGLPRQQIFMLNLATTPASVTGWTSPEWDGSQGNLPGGYPYQCWFTEPFYIQDAAWSPNDQTVYIATTGFHPWNVGTGSTPRSGLCDAAAAFPATQTSVLHKWINYTGCDSLYAAAADAGAMYAAGHERWSQNPNGCDFKGPGAITDAGMEGLDPGSGNALLNSGGAALYTRSRGSGADDELVTSAGLWIASDNGIVKNGTFQPSQVCNGVSGHAGICFLPYPA
jgi:hypothetical protein